MVLIAFIKNAFIYPPAIQWWADRLFYMYFEVFGLITLLVIRYVLLRYIVLHRKKKESEITKDIDVSGKIVNHSFFKSLWLIIIHKRNSLKYLIIWFFITTLSIIFASAFFKLSSFYTPKELYINTLTGYSSNIDHYSWIIGNDKFFLSTQFVQTYNNEISFVLWLTIIYYRICFIIGWFFVTFCFWNKFIRNFGIFFWILGFLIIILSKLFDFYVIK